MKKRLLIALVVVLALAATASLVWAGGQGAQRGVDSDPNAGWLGPIKWLANRAGYHFWFTTTAATPANPYYTAGHSYHNVYKATVDGPGEWCVTGPVVDRKPYNLTGFKGQCMYFKIFDTSTDTQIAPPACPAVVKPECQYMLAP